MLGRVAWDSRPGRTELGLERLGDLLEHFPQRYEDRRQCWTIRQAPLEELEQVA